MRAVTGSVTELKRLAALRALKLLDTPAEARFDRITSLAAAFFGVPMAMVNLVDEARVWVKSCNVGFIDEAPREDSVCTHTIQGEQSLVVPDLAADGRFFQLPTVAGAPHLRFYAGHPIREAGGAAVGALCLVDFKPHDFGVEKTKHLRDFAALVEGELGKEELGKLMQALQRNQALMQRQNEELEAQTEELQAQTEELEAQAEALGAQKEELEAQKEELERQRMFIEGILMSVDSGVVALDNQGQVSFKNAHMSAMSGLPEGVTLVDGIRQGLVRVRNVADTEDIPLSELVPARVMRGESVAHNEMLFILPDGTKNYVSGGGRALLNGAGERIGSLFTMHNFTPRIQMEQALKQQEARFRALSEAAFEGIIISQEGVTTDVNAAFMRMLGYADRAEVIGHTVLKFVHPDSVEAVLERIGEEDEKPYDIVALGRDGSGLDVEVVGRAFDFEGQTLRVAVFRDASQRKKLERMREQFVSVVSHDLKNPLGALSASIEVLNEEVRPKLQLDDEADGDLDFWLDMAQKAVARLLRLTNELLDDERMRLGETALKRQACHTRDLFAEAIGTMAGQASKAKVGLSICGQEVDFAADRDRLLQVLTNLVGNAIKFSPEGGQVHLGAVDGGDHAVLWVEDEGRGIPQDKLEAIFERFTQVEETDASIKGGTGLGLAICQSIVQRHGGRIWAENKAEGGSRFRFTIPRASTKA